VTIYIQRMYEFAFKHSKSIEILLAFCVDRVLLQAGL